MKKVGLLLLKVEGWTKTNILNLPSKSSTVDLEDSDIQGC